MKKLALMFFIALFAAIYMMSCDKEKDDNGNNNTGAITWNVNVDVDLGGTFPVVATAKITITGNTFSAAVTTSEIGGAPEVHHITLTGEVNGDTLTINDAQFNIPMGNDTESVTINTATIIINGNNMTGNGTLTVIPAGSTTPENGTFTLAGTKS